MTDPVRGDYDTSANYLKSLGAAAKGLDLFDEALARVSEPTRLAMTRHVENRWWPAQHAEEFCEAVIAVSDDATLEKIAYLSTSQGLASLVAPLIGVALALTRSSPASLFSRMQTLVGVANRNVAAAWSPQGDSRGTLEIRYPRAASPVVVPLWRGPIRFVFETAKSNGRIERWEQVDDGRVVRFELAW